MLFLNTSTIKAVGLISFSFQLLQFQTLFKKNYVGIITYNAAQMQAVKSATG